MANVDLSWLVQTNISINTLVVQPPSFNSCMIIGVFPTANLPTSWGGLIYHNYTSLSDIISDFSALITGTTLQDNRYQWLINAATRFFAQTPTPSNVYLAQVQTPVVGTAWNYSTVLTTITAAFNDFIGFTIADKLSLTNAAVAATSTTPGFAGTGGLNPALVALKSANNEKICFMDSSDRTIAASLQSGNTGVNDLLVLYHALNFTPVAGGTGSMVSQAAANLQAYFGNIFTTGVNLKILSSLRLASDDVIDTTITTSNIGIPGTNDGGYVTTNNNVYCGFGAGVGIGLMQYGYMSSSTTDQQIYLDQVVGALYMRVTTTAGLVTFLLSKSPSGLLYNDFGIQELLTKYKSLIQLSVDQKIIQAFTNSNFTYTNYAQVAPADIANRIYKDLGFNGNFLSRIQRIANSINLSL